VKTTRQTVHFRFKPELNELLEAASDYLGTTKTALVEECIRLNLDKVVKVEEAKKAVAAKRFKKLRQKS
jgi:predicted DNA-binding protein